jgi:hypothetical protein
VPEHVLARPRWLVAHADDPLTGEQAATFFALAKAAATASRSPI